MSTENTTPADERLRRKEREAARAAQTLRDLEEATARLQAQAEKDEACRQEQAREQARWWEEASPARQEARRQQDERWDVNRIFESYMRSIDKWLEDIK